MKKVLMIGFCFILLGFVLISCATFTNEGERPESEKEEPLSPEVLGSNGNDGAAYLEMSADWPWYGSANALMESADLVFIGEVTDITFAILDSRNGLPITTATENQYRNLYTLYCVDIMEGYKGVDATTVTFMVSGGLRDYNESLQIQLMKENDAQYADLGIPVWAGYDGYNIGECYLFVLSNVEGSYPVLMNMDQSVYSLREFSKIDVTDANQVAITPKSIIATFGYDKLSSFIADVDMDKYK